MVSCLRQVIENIDQTLEGAKRDFFVVDDGCITLEWKISDREKLQIAKELFSDKGLEVGLSSAWLGIYAKGRSYGGAYLNTSRGVY